ncbi:MAG TPA: hypothetical protein ENK91_01880, partial [Bacteroidetes bacterium]|nr:hypothetical protein [Bacteroidota bacterium]
QDLDRGVVVGQRSFGKGLVQNIFPIGYNSKVKITISKYYIPSGRCIQSKVYKNGKAVKIDKNTQNLFYTKNGRKVYDVGGIEPDVIIEKDKYSPLVTNLIKDNVIFKYVNSFVLKNKKIAPVDSFKYEDFDNFKKFVNKLNYNFDTKTENSLNKIKGSIKEDNLDEELITDIDNILNKVKSMKSSLLDKDRDTLLRLIEKEIVKRYYFKTGEIKDSLKNDKEIKKAIEILNNTSEYDKILNPEK